ncbi:hypothetical protein NMG60_11028849 [Bertholletia excelsa]
MAGEEPKQEETHQAEAKMADEHKKPMGPRYAPKDRRRSFYACIAIFLILAGVVALTVWLVYRPEKPKFTVAGVSIFNLNTSSPPFISITTQFSVVTRNPNERVSIIYDNLSAAVQYRNQMISQPVILPPLFHEKHSTVQLAPIVGGGGAMPVSTEAWYGLRTDEANGVVGLRLVLLGKLRWKAGAITTGRYGIYVACDVLLRLTKGFVGQAPFIAPPICKVDV